MTNLKKYFVLLFAFCSATLFAQTEKGRIIAGGNIGYDYFNPDGGSTISIVRVSPNVAYIPVNNLAIGFALTIESIKYNGTTLTTSGVGPLVRYYAPFKYKAYLQAGYFFNSNQLSDSLTVTSTSFIGTVGYALFLNKHISLEPQFYYRYDDSKDDSWVNGKGKGYGFSLGLTAYFGSGKKEEKN